jgi:hypothetical protein
MTVDEKPAPAFTNIDTVAEFQRRRELATRRGAPFLISTFVCALAVVVLYNLSIDPALKVNLFIFFLVGGFASWGVFVYIDSKYVRCPNCEHVPMDNRGRVAIDPVVCPRCGARLRPYDSIFE